MIILHMHMITDLHSNLFRWQGVFLNKIIEHKSHNLNVSNLNKSQKNVAFHHDVSQSEISSIILILTEQKCQVHWTIPTHFFSIHNVKLTWMHHEQHLQLNSHLLYRLLEFERFLCQLMDLKLGKFHLIYFYTIHCW